VRFPAVARKLEFGDLLLPPYALVFIRQYAWSVQSDLAAWAVTVALTLAGWCVYLYLKPEASERTPRAYWIIVALPLLLVYAMRAAIPDLSFDVLNHRLIQGERALRGPQFLDGDFFPNVFPFNPSSDMLTGLFRHALGYRLGTILNLLVLVWAGTIVEKILRPWFARTWQRCLAVLLVLFTEHVMFEISTYMVDLLALPLLLEALSLALTYEESKTKSWALSWSALLLGTALGLKLTNAAMVPPILIVFALQVLSTRKDKRQFKYLALTAVLFLLPLLPHAIYVYRQTGNPFFPLYNNIFRSPYWSTIPFADGRWGPKGWGETLLWPVISFWVPKRLSELSVYAGRLTLGFVAAILCLLAPKIGRNARSIALVVLTGSLMWAATSGYVRYALFIEILGGMLVLYISRFVWQRVNALPRPAGLALAVLPVGLLVAQSALSAGYLRRTEWSLRPMAFDEPQGYRKESRWILRDRELTSFQPAESKEIFAHVDAWIVSSVKSNGVQVLLRSDVPMLAVNYVDYFAQPKGRQRFDRALKDLRDKHVYSLTLRDELDTALEFLKQRNLGVGQVQDVIVPFFSTRTQFHMTLIEIVLPPQHELPRKQPNTPTATVASGPLDDHAFQAELTATGVPSVMKPGQTATIGISVKNLSEYPWPSKPGDRSIYHINVADVWLQSDARTLVNNMDARGTLPIDLWPGERTKAQLTITAPTKPGDYALEIDLVQEGVAFFKDKGSRTWQTTVKVE
jgi:hypothetical protein